MSSDAHPDANPASGPDAGLDTVTSRIALAALDRERLTVDRTLLGLLQRAEELGRPLTVVTPARTLVSPAALAAADRGDWHWVVDDGDGFWDGLTGHALAWDGVAFAPTDDVAPGLVEALRDRGAVHVVTAEVVHPLTQPLVGVLAEEVAALLGTPLTWGAVEPGDQVLTAPHVTRVAQAVAPTASHLPLTGPSAAGLLVVDPEPAGVVERITVATAQEPPADVCERLVDRGAHLAVWTARPGDGGHLCPGVVTDPMALAVAAARVPTLPTGGLGAAGKAGTHVWRRPPGSLPDAVAAFAAALRLVEQHSTWPPRAVAP